MDAPAERWWSTSGILITGMPALRSCITEIGPIEVPARACNGIEPDLPEGPRRNGDEALVKREHLDGSMEVTVSGRCRGFAMGGIRIHHVVVPLARDPRDCSTQQAG